LEKQREWRLGTLSGFLQRWHQLGYEGVAKDVIDLLRGWRIRGNAKGVAVQTLCPQKGPLSELEYAALRQRLVDAFEVGKLSLADLVLAQLFMATGRRPSQLADLKGKDLIETTSSDGFQTFLLNVPRRKQRGSSWRETFKPFALQPELGDAVKSLIESNRQRLQQVAPGQAATENGDLPLFPASRPMADPAAASSRGLSAPDREHMTTRELQTWLVRVVASLEVPSERTGSSLRVFPTRLRRTLATRAAREGYGELVIAELLDHTDTQNVKVYTQNVPEHIDAINEAVARQLAPLAQAFAGVLVDHEGQASRGSDPTSRLRGKEGSVGTCGHHGFCGAAAPIACYTCRNFQPWLDGVHAEVLQSLLGERERIFSITQDKQMAAVNDRSIFAVTQVVQQCEKRHKQLAGGLTQ
jgi:integrase